MNMLTVPEEDVLKSNRPLNADLETPRRYPSRGPEVPLSPEDVRALRKSKRPTKVNVPGQYRGAEGMEGRVVDGCITL
jgi:hypothetical protein